MAKKKEGDTPYIAEIKHFTSRSQRNAKGIVIEKVRPGSDSARFLERMEVRRRTRPCNEPIDMRDRAKGAIRFYLHKGVGHFFDDAAYKTFREGLAQNNGVFTIGMFEDITGRSISARAKTPLKPSTRTESKKQIPKDSPTPPAAPDTAQQPASPLAPPPAITSLILKPTSFDDEYHQRPNPKTITFGYYRKRREPRVLYTTAVSLTIEELVLSGTTKDISLSGVQLVVDVNQWTSPETLGQLVKVSFLELKGSDGKIPAPMAYHIHRIESNDQEINLTLLRDQKENDPAQIQFLKTLIDGQRDRLKIDPEDEVNTAAALLYEQVFAQTLAGVPVFFRINEQGRPTAHTVGITRNNQQLCKFFEDEQGDYDFDFLREPNRVSHICYKLASETLSYDRNRPQGTPFGEATLVLYKNHLGQLFSVCDFELFDADAYLALFQYAFAQHDCLVLKLHASLVRDIDHSKMARAATQLAKKDSASAKSLQNTVRSVFALAFLTDITDIMRKLVSESVGDKNTITADLSQVKSWSNNRWYPLAGLLESKITPTTTDTLPALSTVYFGVFPRRREERYLARTKAEVEINFRRYPATTRDISTRGLSVLVDEPINTTLGQEITVGLVSFGKKAYNFDLRNIPYRIVGVERGKTTRIKLERIKTPDWDTITEFFQEIIELNRAKLSPCVDDAVAHAQSRLYEDVLAAHLLVTPFFIEQKDRLNAKINRVAVSVHSTELADYFYTDSGLLDYRGLTNPTVIQNVIASCLEPTEVDHGGRTLELYLYKVPGETPSEIIFASATGVSLATQREKLDFIHTGIMTGTFRAYAISAQRIRDLDAYTQDSIIEEVRQISRHRASQLDQEIKSLTDYGELADITQDVLRLVAATQQNGATVHA